MEKGKSQWNLTSLSLLTVTVAITSKTKKITVQSNVIGSSVLCIH